MFDQYLFIPGLLGISTASNRPVKQAGALLILREVVEPCIGYCLSCGKYCHLRASVKKGQFELGEFALKCLWDHATGKRFL